MQGATANISPNPAQHGAAPHVRVRVTFAALMLVILLAALDATALASALPAIVADLDGLREIAWVTTGFMLAQTAAAPLYGKLGDLYGRKVVLQSAVAIFVIGSVLCGLSSSMVQLVAARSVQGAGAGGLMVLVQAVTGDIVAPRDRAKYQTLFGAVFGVASIAGPLLGGFFVEQLSWRWIFFVNLPLGLAALGVLAVTLPRSRARAAARIDWPGAALVAAGLSALSLLVTLGGSEWPWGSAPTLALGAAAVLLLGAFCAVERRATEPILPPSLVRDPVFRVAAPLSALLGCAMFGVVTFTPLYFQVVHGDSPTTSGLRLAAMMGGIIVAGFATGRVISRTGRYRAFPIAGFATMTVGLAALATIGERTSPWSVCIALAIFGAGLGMTMQILVMAVQNAVPHAILGTATSAVTVVRGMGTALGPALLGALFAAGLGATARLDPIAVAELPAGARETARAAYVGALRPVYLIAAAIAGAGLVLALRLRELPLRTTVGEPEAPDVGPNAAIALARIHRHGIEHARQLALAEGVERTAIQAVDRELRERGLCETRDGVESLSPHGRELAARITTQPQLQPANI